MRSVTHRAKQRIGIAAMPCRPQWSLHISSREELHISFGLQRLVHLFHTLDRSQTLCQKIGGAGEGYDMGDAWFTMVHSS